MTSHYYHILRISIKLTQIISSRQRYRNDEWLLINEDSSCNDAGYYKDVPDIRRYLRVEKFTEVKCLQPQIQCKTFETRTTTLNASLLAGVRCGETGEGEGTIVTDQTGDSYEDTVTIECRHGHHRVTGSHLRTCLGGGTWSGKTLVCART